MTITFNNKECELKRLTLSQQLGHLAYLRSVVIDEIKKHMIGLPLKLCEYIWLEARKEVKAIDLGTPEYFEACTKFDALANALVLSIGEKDFKLKDGIQVLDKDLANLGQSILFDVLGFPRKAE